MLVQDTPTATFLDNPDLSMQTLSPREKTPLESTCHEIAEDFSRQIRALSIGSASTVPIAKLQRLLGFLPFSSDEYAVANRRVENAMRYVRQDELGAAKWELNATLGQIRNMANARTVEPRPRRR